MANGKDYYQILGVGRNATQEEIKKAYRKLAREHHPDMVNSSDKTTAEKRFKEINEAYQILSDPQKKKMYDQFGSAAFSGAQGPGGFGGFSSSGGQWGPFTYTYKTTGNAQDFGFGDFDPFDVFEEFFGFRGFGRSRTPKKGKNLYYDLMIDFKDAVFGLEKNINIDSGKVRIKIPQGVRNGTEMRFAGKGMPGPSGLPPGDLFLTIRMNKPKDFDIFRDTVLVKKEIDFTQAILGDVIEIPAIDLKSKSGVGKTKLKIPSGTQHGTRFVVRNKGMPKLRGRGQGDVLVEVSIKIPKKLTRNQRKILEQYIKS